MSEASKNSKLQVRDLRNGNWYWIHKEVLERHVKKIGVLGVAVYNALAYFSDGNQKSFPSQKHLADFFGYSRSSIHRAIKLLERHGLIRVEKKGHHCIYYLLKVRCSSHNTRMSHRRNRYVSQADTNDNKLTRINNNDIDSKNIFGSDSNAFKGFRPKNKQELLALDLAKSLNDMKGLPLYLSYSKKYPESLLRTVLGEVKEIPDRKIKKGRAALFNYLVQKYVKDTSDNLRD